MKSRGRYQESRLRFGASGDATLTNRITGRCEPQLRLGDSSCVRLSQTTLRRRSLGSATRSSCDSPLLFLTLLPNRQRPEARLAKYHEHQNAHGYSKWIILDRGSARPMGMGVARAKGIRL